MPKTKPEETEPKEEEAKGGKLTASSIAKNIEEYKTVLGLRRQAYAQHMKTCVIDQALRNWADRMTSSKGKSVKVWHQELPWLEALMVVRYGEAVEHWPAATSIADYGRALDWEAGREEPFPVIRARSMNLSGKE